MLALKAKTGKSCVLDWFLIDLERLQLLQERPNWQALIAFTSIHVLSREGSQSRREESSGPFVEGTDRDYDQ